ncbi:hypothetical protein [Alteromonas flava]|uniref:hypothetical protein n=1 Tax=Alteromonas flava TaxID=2048003 RepID=UPI000C2891B3|nr:hypothetical protein [Alteromonas flava]
MNLKDLNHASTPEPLRTINEAIQNVLCEEDTDSEALLTLIAQRDDFIQQYLNTLDSEERKAFSSAEIDVNNYLIARVAEIGKSTLIEATSQIRKRKAANKYLE